MKYDLNQTTEYRGYYRRYIELIGKDARTAPEDTELATLATTLADYMIKASDWNAMETSVTNVGTALSNHAALTSHTPFVVTTGSANAYIAARNPALTSYVAGAALSVQINATNTGASTINVNGLGAKSIVDSKGSAMIAGKLRLNSVYTLRYNGTAFMLQGEGGDYGTAVASEVLSGKTIGTDNGILNGAMPNRAGDTAAIASSISGTTLKLRASNGYRDGIDDNVTITDADFIAANIPEDLSMFGLQGTLVRGKRFATGSITTGSGTLPFIDGVGQTVNRSYIQSPNLGFIPSTVILYLAAGQYAYYTVASTNFSVGTSWITRIFMLGYTAYIYLALDGTQAYMNASGFRLPTQNSTGAVTTYYAFE